MVVVMGIAEKPGGGVISLPLVMPEKKLYREGVVLLPWADSHTGNHPEDGFMPLETIQRLLVVIGRRSHSGFEEEAFKLDRRAVYRVSGRFVIISNFLVVMKGGQYFLMNAFSKRSHVVTNPNESLFIHLKAGPLSVIVAIDLELDVIADLGFYHAWFNVVLDPSQYVNPPREALHPSWWAFDETRAKVRQSIPRSPSSSSEDYNEEREIEPRPEPTRAATPPLRVASPRIRRLEKRTVGFEGAQSRGESRVKRNTEGGRPLEESPRGNGGQSVNLPPLLAAHLGRGENGKPFQSSLTSAYGGQALLNNIGRNLPSNGTFLSHCAQPFIPASLSAVLNPVGSITPFVRWIEDYPLPDRLKMPSHVGYYDGKGDPYNFLYLFKGAIRMQKWLMPVAYHMFTYTLKDSAIIWWNSQKAGSILDYKDFKATFRSYFSQQKKFTKTYLAVHNIKQREGESTRAFITRYTDDTLLENNESWETYTWVEAREVATNGASSDRRDSFKSLKEILATEKAARSFKPPPKMVKSKRSRDMSKYCHFHEDYRHDTNDCRHLRTQIQEAVNSGQLLHLMKGIKKERTKSSDTPRGESKKDKGTAPVESPILMVSREAHIVKSLTQENTDYGGKEIIFPPVAKVNNAPVIIEAKILEERWSEYTWIAEAHLPEHFKKELQDLLKSNADVIAWTHANITGILRTIMVEGKPFSTEHKLNEYSHVKPIKQNKRGLGPDRNMEACKETEELTKAGIL
ncbi:hypothetical protein Tco_0287596 [Tanacetum coccineum]